ncbi:hypothetical protein CLOM_g14791 [Closterium sp. NIES-68]|nr:hypothetical protein CLOM_g14791 [Closterium sp. NIES-68]
MQQQQQREPEDGPITNIENRGGRVLVNPKVYIIYYGTWPEGSGQDALENFVNSLGGEAGEQGERSGENSVRKWWDITTNYYQNEEDGSQTFVSPQ